MIENGRTRQIADLVGRMTEAEFGRCDVLRGDFQNNSGPRRNTAHEQLVAHLQEIDRRQTNERPANPHAAD